MRTFRQVALAFGSILLCSAFALGQARLGPYVVDSNGVKVGHAQDASNVLMFINGTPTVVIAGPSGFSPSTFFLYFADDACGTQPLLQVAPGLFFSTGVYTTDGMVRYVNAAAEASTLFLSARIVNTDGSMNPCTPMNISFPAAPALTGSVSEFTPPFSVVDALPVTPAPGTATFNDVPTTHPFFRYIEALSNSGITGGCSVSPPLYCPNNNVTRGQLAVFLAKALGL